MDSVEFWVGLFFFVPVLFSSLWSLLEFRALVSVPAVMIPFQVFGRLGRA